MKTEYVQVYKEIKSIIKEAIEKKILTTNTLYYFNYDSITIEFEDSRDSLSTSIEFEYTSYELGQIQLILYTTNCDSCTEIAIINTDRNNVCHCLDNLIKLAEQINNINAQ